MVGIELKNHTQLRYMREAGLVVAQMHAALRAAAAPGVSGVELDQVCRDTIKAAGAKSNFLGYYGYPASVCISVNDTVVHGIPTATPLRAGDIVSFDCGAYVERDGKQWHSDAAFTMIIGGDAAGTRADRELSAVTRTALHRAIASLVGAKTVKTVGERVEETIEEHVAAGGVGVEIVEEFVGHGIGTAMHMDPDVINFRARGRFAKLKPGMVLAIEPILTLGNAKTKTLADEWTVKTVDGTNAAHWEHSVAILPGGISVLSAPDAGRELLAPYGIEPISLD